jgi:hypothetical protein
MRSILLRFLVASVLLAGSSTSSEIARASLPVSVAFAPHASDLAHEVHAEPEKERRVRRLLKKEITRDIALQARRIVDQYHHEEFGTEIAFTSGDLSLVARIEQHYHPPGGEARPWGYHPGVSVLVVEDNQ